MLLLLVLFCMWLNHAQSLDTERASLDRARDESIDAARDESLDRARDESLDTERARDESLDTCSASLEVKIPKKSINKLVFDFCNVCTKYLTEGNRHHISCSHGCCSLCYFGDEKSRCRICKKPFYEIKQVKTP